MSDQPTVAVVGAGFSGVLTALRLLLTQDGPRVVLIEKGPRFGRGAAYSTGNPGHLLNVRATNMSALVEQPNHFIDWLGAAGVAAPEQVFVTRDRYGQYLQSLLREATADRSSVRLALEHDEVTAVARDGNRWRLSLAMGRSLTADAVVLAMGNLPPPPPAGLDSALAKSERYVADPWAWAGPREGGAGEVLILGTGLTAIDIVLSIDAAQPGAPMTALSRHGLLPRVHGEASPAAALVVPPAGPLTAVLAEVRRRAEIDWRGAVDSLRPYVQTLWRGWSLAERRRFLRHLAAWWNIHRHRLAPEVAARIEALRQSGRLSVAAGRIERLTPMADGVEVVWTPRGQATPRTRRVAQVINCTGPRGDLAHADDPLIASLLAAGLVRADACRLGVDVDARSRVIGAAGEAADSLFAVGPLTRGQFYEITSVPDIRLQAADCTDSIVNALALRGRGGAASSADRMADDLAAFLEQSIAELDVELGSLKFARRMRSAWELRGRRAALDEIALWLDERQAKAKR
ncbi:MAG TPA: FAD-dependent oxidoreductase [Caulobacteraceae bacterium]|nr:FAD-dependent oxidoreductase [Caulobacteraceae bacterium]